MVLPIQIGVVALIVGGFLVYLTVKGADETTMLTPPVGKIVPLVSKAGRFRIGVPNGVTANRVGETVTLSTKDKSLVVTAGPFGGGSLTANSEAFVSSLKETYSKVRVLGTQPQMVDGREALATFGQALNAKKVRVRFVSVVVAARPRNYAINSFTRFDSDPSTILPTVNAIVNSFRVLD